MYLKLNLYFSSSKSSPHALLRKRELAHTASVCKLAVNRQPGFRQKDSYTWLTLLLFSFFTILSGFCNCMKYLRMLFLMNCKLAVNRQPGSRQKDSYTWLTLLVFFFFSIFSAFCNCLQWYRMLLLIKMLDFFS